MLTALAFLFLAAFHKSNMDGYVVAFLIPLLVGALISKDEKAHGEAVIAGLAKPMFGIIALAAALTALVAYLVVGPVAGPTGDILMQDVELMSLVMLAVPAVVIALIFHGKHLITALAVGTMAGAAVGLVTGVLTPTDLVRFPEPFKAEGVLVDAVTTALPTTAFLMVVFPFLSVMEASGTLEALGKVVARGAKGPRSVELATVTATGLLAMVTGVISVAIISIGDIVRRLGLEFNVHGYRRANLMDCAGVSFCFIVPWTVHAIVPAMLANAADSPGAGSIVSPIDVCTHNYYAWAMLVVLILSIVSGYGRSFVTDSTTEGDG